MTWVARGKRAKATLKFLLRQQSLPRRVSLGRYKMPPRNKSKALWNTLSHAKRGGCQRALHRNTPLLWSLWSVTSRGRKRKRWEGQKEEGKWVSCFPVAMPGKAGGWMRVHGRSPSPENVAEGCRKTEHPCQCFVCLRQHNPRHNFMAFTKSLALPASAHGILSPSFCFPIWSHQELICTCRRQSGFLPGPTESRLGSNFSFHSSPNLHGFFSLPPATLLCCKPRVKVFRQGCSEPVLDGERK